MNLTIKRILVFLFAIAFLCQCTKEKTTSALGSPMSLHFGNLIKIGGEENLSSLELTQVEDNRCADCNVCYTSRVKITLELKMVDREEFPISLAMLQCGSEEGLPSSLDTVGYSFEFLSIKPYPTGDSISLVDYVAEIIVNKL